LLCRSQYLYLSPQCFLYFYDTPPKDSITWLSFVSWPRISILDAFSHSFKHFKDNFFKDVVQSTSHLLFDDNNVITKFPFYQTDNPWRYKGIQNEDLSMEDRHIVRVLENFVISCLLKP